MKRKMFKNILFNRPFEIKRIPGFQSLALFTFACLYGPILILIVYSFNSSSSLGVFESFSFRWYVAAWENEKVQEAALRRTNAPAEDLVCRQNCFLDVTKIIARISKYFHFVGFGNFLHLQHKTT